MNQLLSPETYIHTEAMHNTQAAHQIVPFVIHLLQPRSVLDLGCGLGTWLFEFKKHGVTDVLGLDTPYVDQKLLSKYLDDEEYMATDLSIPLQLNRRFDLAISLEVAEHLPESTADVFVSNLVNGSDTILFSAAIPGQIGQNHLNEQWPSYWAAKFQKHGFLCYDPVRPEFWNNAQVDFWYRQNMLLYSKTPLDANPAVALDLVHPELHLEKLRKIYSYSHQISRIRSGKVGISFYLKTLLKSALHFGRKIDNA